MYQVKELFTVTSATEISQRNANSAFFAIFDRKRANNLPKKANLYQSYDRNGAKLSFMYSTRGGVEDTRLEAKAKDTKKIRGQGQPFRGQTLSRPRTGMLEAKNQGHSRKCFPKKKGLQKGISGNLQFIGVARIFDWRGLNHKSHAITSSKICLFFT